MSGNAYRDPSDRVDLPDPEDAAIARISARARRVRMAIHVPILLLGIATSVVLYIFLRDLQFARNGAHFPWVTGSASFVTGLGGSFVLAPRLANAVVRLLLPGWRRQLARTYDLDLEQFAETTRLLE